MKKVKNHISIRDTFFISLIVLVTTLLSVWIVGLGYQNSVLENSLWSTTLLSIIFFLFISVGLYRGFKIKNDIGKLSDEFSLDNVSLPEVHMDMPFFFLGEGIEGCLLTLGLFLFMAMFLSFLIWILGPTLWVTFVVFISMLYWLFFRALRLVFKRSKECRGKFIKSILFAMLHTILYNCWIYGLIYLINQIPAA